MRQKALNLSKALPAMCGVDSMPESNDAANNLLFNAQKRSTFSAAKIGVSLNSPHLTQGRTESAEQVLFMGVIMSIKYQNNYLFLSDSVYLQIMLFSEHLGFHHGIRMFTFQKLLQISLICLIWTKFTPSWFET